MIWPLRIVLLLLTACNLSAARAATMNFSELPIGSLSVPGSYESGGIGFHLNKTGGALIEDLGSLTPLLLHSGTEFSLDIPAGTNLASLTLFKQVNDSYLSINGESAGLETLRGTAGILGGVAYWCDGDLMPIELNGPINSLTLTSPAAPLQGELWIIEITLVPEPSTYALAAIGAAALISVRRRKPRHDMRT